MDGKREKNRRENVERREKRERERDELVSISSHDCCLMC